MIYRLPTQRPAEWVVCGYWQDGRPVPVAAMEYAGPSYTTTGQSWAILVEAWSALRAFEVAAEEILALRNRREAA